ncbi:phosphatase domain-containing protein [Parerythrobacter jejuensis]|uniref:DUF2183 domain-containing protein n=1 Tax=Parerythrobacter jejuensis TaxID=795812 RepID=A0A845B482_9SPHN|nr:App1 family protein [Parerythrobacter jejuensis]MXP31018.1 DUF2183 domain-containing protein [Parerythrobacter jejuensis]MXP33778.1 DUF2183 domain-containing protein [Parerythrobacter jejuensis]
MALFQDSPVRIQPYFGYRSRTALRLTARALKATKPGFKQGGRWQAMRTMIAQFASREAENIEVRLEYARPDGAVFEQTAISDKEGFLHFDIDLSGPWDYPVHTAWEVATLQWYNRDGAQCVDGHILVPGQDIDLGIISDIDDTIIETGITGGLRSLLRNWQRVLAELPHERIVVPGANLFYHALGGGSVRVEDSGEAGTRLPATHRPFFYVSSSPWNLYSYLVTFQRTRNLPLGPLLLRDWGLNSATFGKASHGSHKVDAIKGILSKYSDLRFALIGDDSQGDLVAFSTIASESPDQIAAVFIRTTEHELSPDEVAAKASITSAGIPLWLGDSYAIGQDFLRAAGVTPHGDTSRIVETVERREHHAH